MILFDPSGCAAICCKSKNPYVLLAMEDLRQDFARVNEAGQLPALTEEERAAGVVIEACPELADPIGHEGFAIQSRDGRIYLSGESDLGTMWAIYTFSEKVLGVDPLYRFNDLEVEKRERLELDGIDLRDRPRGFRFRGAFLNDEDLLTGWKEGGGVRFADYHHYGVTVSPAALEPVVETLLRLKLNLVIPASLLDLDNPPEKALADCVARRGLYLSQHHIEPVGVSAFNFENYCKRRGVEGEFSFFHCPDRMQEVWRHYAEKWAAYDRVIWQLGLRGKGDKPVWQESEPSREELKEYGAGISRAMACQKQVIQEVAGARARHFSTTLWLEGSRLMDEGFLTVPEGTVTVFSDNGTNQMFGPDFHTTPRVGESGIYYHVQYFGDGPHLAPLTGLDKLSYNLMQAYDKGDRDYCILNTSNVREFTFELGAYGRLLWDPEGFSKEDYLREYTALFGDRQEEAARLIRDYFQCVATVPDEAVRRYMQSGFHYNWEERPAGIKNFVIKEGKAVLLGRALMRIFRHTPPEELIQYRDHRDYVAAALPGWADQCRAWEALSQALPERAKKHVAVKWLLHAKTVYALYAWYVHVVNAKEHYDAFRGEACLRELQAACAALEALLSYRRCAEEGPFEHWYRGDRKIDVRMRLAETRALMSLAPQ